MILLQLRLLEEILKSEQDRDRERDGDDEVFLIHLKSVPGACRYPHSGWVAPQ
jgi:hypothetical protein